MKPPALPETDDPYLLLDVRPGASAEQIRRAYLRRVKEWKPDRHPAEFRRVREAYDRLREQEQWFDAWRQAGDVVRRAAEAAAHTEADAEVPADTQAGEAEADARRETSPRSDASRAATPDEAGEASATSEAVRAELEQALEHDVLHIHADAQAGEADDEDVDALIAALEQELREHPEPGDADEDIEPEDTDEDAPRLHPLDAAEHRRRARVAERAEHLAALEHDVHAALERGRLAEAADRLLEPGTEAIAARREFAPLLLEVCCAVVWELPPRFAALVARYGDLVSSHDTEHHDGALLHRRNLEGELPAWRRAVADWPELHRFLALGSSLRAPAEAELGLRLGRRAAADPTGFLQVLARAAEQAPGIVALHTAMAERWARCYGRLPLQRPARARPTVEQAAEALAEVTLHHRRVRWEQARPLLVALVLVLVPLLAASPVIELVLLGFIILLWAWRAKWSGTEARIYVQVVRPAAAAWLWATRATPDALASALHERLPTRGTWAAVLHPGALDEYPEQLRNDLALLAFAATSPMIPLLRAPSGAAGSSSA
jgi:curved DNA-binding protein CbpA